MRLANLPASALVYSGVLAQIAERSDVLSGKTLKNYLSVLTAAVKLSVKDRVLAEDPLGKVEYSKWQRKPVDPFTMEERDLILRGMAEHFPAAVNMITTWAYTGMRTSEVFGLR